MKLVKKDMLGACVICGQVKKGGYIDVSPVDYLCLDCAREIAEIYNKNFAEWQELENKQDSIIKKR
jgi:DNA-directed RNA polymerase subunit RPC12/RpoP